MDKLKVAMEVVKKYHFWILYGLILVVGLASWYLAGNAVASLFDDRKGNIDQDFSKIQQIQNTPNHPNQKCIERWNELAKAHAVTVLKGWETLYDQQEKDNKLYDQLSPQCQELFHCTEPVFAGNMVSYTVRSGGQLIQRNIPVNDFNDYLREYQREIPQYVRSLWNTIDVRKPVQGEAPAARQPAGAGAHGAAARRPPPKAGTARYTGLVECNPKDRQEFEARFDWTQRPEYFDVRLAQEDLWVYEALLKIIRDTNEGYSEANYHDAPIKRIDALEIGKAAADSWQREMGSGAVASAPSSSGHKTPEGAESSGSTRQSLLSHRYVDNNVAPLAAGPNGEVPHTFPEFKIMPIRMKLLINQLKINKLLTLCANSVMPIEVKSVRLNPGSGGTINLAGVGAANVEQSGQPTRGAGERPGQPVGASEMTEPSALDVTVEILGVICIYEPPKLELLGAGAAVGDPNAAAGPTDPTGTTPALEPTPPVDETTPSAGTAPGTTPPAPGTTAPEPTPPGTTPDAG